MFSGCVVYMCGLNQAHHDSSVATVSITCVAMHVLQVMGIAVI